MSFRVFGTGAAAIALAVSGPATASVRPGSAVPTAASATSVSSTAPYRVARSMTPWPAYLAIALTLAVDIWIALDDDDSDSAISRG